MGDLAATEAFGGTSRFSIVRRLGAGGMGVVYLAQDRERDRLVALKTLISVDPAEIYGLKQEFRALVGVSHPNLVDFYELIADERWFFTMEYVDGVDFLRFARSAVALRPDGAHGSSMADTASLRSIVGLTRELDASCASAPTMSADEVAGAQALADTRVFGAARPVADGAYPLEPRITLPPLDEGRLRPALGQLVNAIAAIHGAGLLHLDIKPSNVLVTPAGRVVVLDFGLVAEQRRGRHHLDDDLRPSGGTAGYMAPEQALGAPVSEASDWYGTGALLYEVLTGQLPFEGTIREILLAKTSSEPPPPRALAPGAPEDLSELCALLLRRDPARRPGTEEISRRLGGERVSIDLSRSIRLDAPASLVGREPHLAALREAFDAAARGAAVTVTIHGCSGMGKSAVVKLFLDGLVERREALVLEGRCYERESVPYKAFDSLVDRLARHLVRLPPHELDAALPPQRAALARLFPVLGQVPAIAAALRGSPPIPDLQELRRQGFMALRELFTRLATSRPTVLFIDDLQWGDLDSAALLSALLLPPDPPRLLLVASYRSEDSETSPLLTAMRREWDKGVLEPPREIAIGPLTEPQARALSLTVLAASDPDRVAKAELVTRESAGHPYFVTELARHLDSRSAVAEGARVSLDEMIWGRVLELPAEARALLELVAVAGRPIPKALIFHAFGASLGERSPRDAGDHALNVLQARSMVRTSGARADDAIETFHDRIRESVVERLAPERTRELHGRLAAAIESLGGGDAETLVVHLEGSGERARAGEYAAVAAGKAAGALAFDRAAMLYRKALDLQLAGANRHSLRERLADALANAGRGGEAGRAYLDAAHGAAGTHALELRRRAAEQLLVSGHTDAGIDALRSVIGAVGMRVASTPQRALPSILVQRAFIRVRGLGYAERDPARISEEELTRIDICWAAAVGLSMVDNVRAADFQARHLLLALRLGEPTRVARAIAFELGFVAGPGSAADAATAKLMRYAERLAAQVDTPHSRTFMTLMKGVTDYLGGRFRSCLAHCENAELDLRERCSGVLWEHTSAQRFSLGSLMYMGRIRELSRRAPALLRRAEDRGNRYAATDLRTRFTLTWLAADDPARAGAEVDDALRRWSQEGFHLQHYNSLLALVQRDLYVGDADAAWRRLDARWSALKRSMLLRIQLLRTEVVHLRARAALALAADRRPPGRWLALAEKDADRIAAERAPWAHPLALMVRAAVAAGSGKRTAAAELASDAASRFDAADMALHAAVARRRRGEIVGGDAGRALVDGADAWMRGEGIVNPDRMAALLAPGPWKGVR